MVREKEIRANEQVLGGPVPADATVVFVGRIRTPRSDRLQAPRQGRHDGPVCRVEVFKPWSPALRGLERFECVEVLYWLHLSRREYATALRLGTAEAEAILRSFTRENTQHPTYKALMELGKAVKKRCSWLATCTTAHSGRRSTTG